MAIKAVGFEPDFEQELNILRELRAHPNIVEYIGACKRVPFQGFIVLEFMTLGSLDKYIHDKSFKLSLSYSMRVAYDVMQGLAHLHRSKIMHLDMKPANVLVSSLSVAADACVKLADFGLSQSRDTNESFKGDYVEGTLLYMAPEMLAEKLFSVKGDVFSAGMTFWEVRCIVCCHVLTSFVCSFIDDGSQTTVQFAQIYQTEKAAIRRGARTRRAARRFERNQSVVSA